MGEAQKEHAEYVVLEPDGKIILPENIMEKYVLETPGCDLWFGDKYLAVGLKLQRGLDNPAYPILRQKGAGGGVVGVLDAAEFFKKVAVDPAQNAKEFPAVFYREHTLLEFRLKPPTIDWASVEETLLDPSTALGDDELL
jgi:hypothetical protein